LQAIRDFAFPAAPDDLLHEDDAMVRMGLPPLRIEVLKKISGVEFEDCWPRRVVIEDDDLRIPIISLEDLKHLAHGSTIHPRPASPSTYGLAEQVTDSRSNSDSAIRMVVPIRIARIFSTSENAARWAAGPVDNRSAGYQPAPQPAGHFHPRS